MTKQPLVSVCIPVYNTELYIKETMDCLVNQTYKNLEVIFSDNCCTDKTIEIIKSYNDPRVKIFKNKINMGHVYNFRKVLSYATGKYMKLIGADDGMELDAIEKAVAIFEDEKYKDVALVNSYCTIINNKSEKVLIKKFIFGGGLYSSYWAIRSNFIYGSHAVGDPNCSLFKKSDYDKIPEPKFRNGNDWTLDLDMHMELLLNGKLFIIPKPLGRFRISPQSTSNRQLRFVQSKLFKQYVTNIYKDKRYKLSYIWVIIGTITSIMLQFARNFLYVFFIKEKKQ
jgi:glycosyltransferase involved in cell wall biosynthesis